MTMLDRYIARQYAINVAALLVVFTSLFIAVDSVLNVGKFIEAGADLAGERGTLRHGVTTALWLVNYWGPKALQLFNFLAGMAVVAGMGFTCAQMTKRRELVAAVASGVSLQRLALPFVAVGLAVSAAQAVNHEVFVPAVAPLLTRTASDALRRDVRPFEATLVRDGAGRLWHASEFDAAKRTLTDVRVWERDGAGRVTRRIRAPRATWDGTAWVFDAPTVEPPEARPTPEPGAGAGPVTPSPVRIVTDLDPTGMIARQFADYGQNLSWRQISRMFAGAPVDERTRERFERVRWGRVSTMAGNMLALVILMPFFLTREPKNMLAQSVKAAPLGLAALIGASLGPAFPMPGLPVWVGVFAPTLALAPVAIASAVSVKT